MLPCIMSNGFEILIELAVNNGYLVTAVTDKLTQAKQGKQVWQGIAQCIISQGQQDWQRYVIYLQL